MMNFFLEHYDEDKRDWINKGITYDDALDMALGVYRDNDMTRDMLTIPNRIRLNTSCYIVVKGEHGVTALDGIINLLPKGVGYDDDGNRIAE